MSVRALPSVVVVSLLSSCVTAGTYDELLVQHERVKRDAAAAELTASAAEKKASTTEAERARTAKALADELARTAALTAEKTKLATTQASTEAELKRTSTELAQTLKDKAGLKASVDDMKVALDELAKRKAESDRRVAEYKALLGRFQALIDAGKLKVKIVDGRMVVALASDILFASGSAALSKEGQASVVEVAAVLAGLADSRAFQVEGHTDNVPIKTTQFPSNWELASARAITVLRAMVDAGLPATRVSAASFGDSKPSTSNETPEGRAQNRRIEIVVVPDLSTLPGFDELKAL
jgi:chemotaxis protein MotB